MLHEKLQISSTTYILSQWPKTGKRCVRILVSTSNAKFRYYIKGLKTKIRKYSSLANKVSYTQMMVLAVCNGFPKLHFFIRNLAQHYVCLSCSMLQYTLKKGKVHALYRSQINRRDYTYTYYMFSIHNTKSYFWMKFRTS